MAAWKRAVRRVARSAGYDVVRFPSADSHAGHLRALLERYGVTCVLDVGAHEGEFGLMLREIGYGGRIVSYEPVAEPFGGLARRAAADDGWSAHRAALGEVAETRTIRVAVSTYMSSFRPRSIESARLHGRLSEVEREEAVEVWRLDAELDRHAAAGERVFLKVDTQGWELEVLRGAAGSLDRVAAVQVEAAVRPLYEDAPTFAELIGYLGERGFELTGTFAVDRDEHLRVTELDCVLVRAPSA